MKTFYKVIGGLVLAFVIIAIGLNIYFTDERLKSLTMPYVNEAVGRDVQVENMSLTFFSTFPRPGVRITNMSVPGETSEDTLMSLDQGVVGIHLFPLLRNEISISEIKLYAPRFTYTVYEDSTTNLDFLLPEDAQVDTAAEPVYAISIPYFELHDGRFGYVDHTSNTDMRFRDLDADISLRYADLIESSVDMQLGGLSAKISGSQYVSELPLRLSQSSTIDLANETLSIDSGTLALRGLSLDLSGAVSDWNSSTTLDLSFNSSSDNFGELLKLVPREHEEYISNLETRGSFSLTGSVQGPITGEQIPSYSMKVNVADGYLKNPELPEPIRDVQFQAEATDTLLTVTRLTARAGENSVSARGRLTEPHSKSGNFELDASGNVDLSTVNAFYDITRFDMEQMDGKLDFEVQTRGSRKSPENATMSGNFTLADGMLQYAGVPRRIENINIRASAENRRIDISDMGLDAGPNTFTIKGSVLNFMDESNRQVDLNANLRFELGTLKEFYPINEDSLDMRGTLTAQATLKGKADPVEQSVQSGSLTLKDGMIDYAGFDKPFVNVSFESVLEGPRLTIVSGGFNTGENRIKTSGIITDYLSEERTIDLKIDGFTRLSEITNYYELEPTISELTGAADLNLRARGQVDRPAEMAFNGSMEISDMNMNGEGLVQPIKELNGKLSLTPQAATLDKLAFMFGSSDMNLSGSLNDYMEYLSLKEERTETPSLSGSYRSKFLNIDEIIDWEEDTTDAVPIYLPDLNSTVTARVNKMVVTGVVMQNLQAEAEITPEKIEMTRGSADILEGTTTGTLVWDVPQPEHTMITFKGSLDSVRAEAFFREYPVLGKKSKFHEYISGAFSAQVDYFSELNVYLTPLINTTKMDGTFGMTKARLKGHPIQEEVADMFKAKEFRNIVLDEWKSTFSVANSVLTIKNLRLTSGDIGVEMNGSQHLVKETLDYQMKLLLPGRYKKAVASVITEQATNALVQENGTIMVPLRVTGTMDTPVIRPDQEVIEPILKKYLKDKAGNVLKKLFDG